MTKPMARPMSASDTHTVTTPGCGHATKAMKSEPMMAKRKPAPSTGLTPCLSMILPDMGEPMPVNRPRMMRK